MNVVSYRGGKVHSLMPGSDEHPYPLCRGGGMNQQLTKFRTIDSPLTCKTCLGYAERREANKNAMIINVQKGQIVTDSGETVTEEFPQAQTLEQIHANIERAASLAEAENAEGLEELAQETESLISGLPTRGKLPSGETWAKTKKDMRAAFKAASQAQPKEEAKAPAAEVVSAKEYTAYPDVVELVHMGAEKMAEGVRLHLKTSVTAKEIASITLDMWRRIPNKEGNPDIMGTSDAAKKAFRALLTEAGNGFERTWDNEEALKKLQRSVQDQRSDVRAEYLRSLDTEEAERQYFAKALENKPDDVPVSQFIADLYGTSLKGVTELKRERYQAKKELEAAGQAVTADTDEDDESTTTPDQRIQIAIQRLKVDVIKAKPEDFENASEEAKEAARAELEELFKAIKEMIAATL